MESNRPGILLLDGPSCSGKSGAKRALLENCPDLVFCPRITTRPPREKESDADYDFVSKQEFEELEHAGELAAWRHFDFGMSYGLPKTRVEEALAAGNTVLCLIDLGTVTQAKACWPQASGVLLYAPEEDLEKRLRSRGSHSQAQISERLENARKVWSQREQYDHVVINRDGEWDKTLAQLLDIATKLPS